MRNPLNGHLRLRAPACSCDAYTNWHKYRQISFNHAGFSVLVGADNVLVFLLVGG
jgi:hypothetical protein